LFFPGGLHQDLVSRDPIWASLPDSPEVLTVLLFRHCCLRITAVVQILRQLGLDITDEEIRRYLTPSKVMATELGLSSPSETDASVLRIFNRIWRRVRLHLVPGDSPEQLFDLTVGREDRANDNVQAILHSGDHNPQEERPDDVHGGDDGGHQERDLGTRVVTVESNDEAIATASRPSARNLEEIPEVRPREEEELDYEADEPIDDGAEPEEGELPDESNGKTRSSAVEAETQDEESSSGDSDDDDDDDDSVRSIPSPSYAAAAAGGNGGQQRTVTVSSTALYNRVGSATVTERG
jgi:hypothetical protein